MDSYEDISHKLGSKYTVCLQTQAEQRYLLVLTFRTTGILHTEYKLVMMKLIYGSVRQLRILGHLRVLLGIKPPLSNSCLISA